MNRTRTMIGLALVGGLVAIMTSGWNNTAFAGPRACEKVKACAPVAIAPPPPACAPVVVTPSPKACEPVKSRISQVIPHGVVLHTLHVRLHSAAYALKHGVAETEYVSPQPTPATSGTVPPAPAPEPTKPVGLSDKT